jgi:hypothetical protein
MTTPVHGVVMVHARSVMWRSIISPLLTAAEDGQVEPTKRALRKLMDQMKRVVPDVDL